MSNLTLPPPREPVIDPRTNTFSRNWILYFQQLFTRVGGSSSDTNAAISALITQIFLDIADRDVNSAFADAVPQPRSADADPFGAPPVVIPDQQEPPSYDAKIAELRKEIEQLKSIIALI